MKKNNRKPRREVGLFRRQMKRDLDLYRQILKAMEECPEARCDSIRGLPGITHAMFAHHVKLLTQAGLIEAIDISSHDGDDWLLLSITHEGYEFIDAVREDSIWNKTKEKALSSTGTISLEILKTTAQAVIKGLLAAHNINA